MACFLNLPTEEAKYRFVQGKGIRGSSHLGTHLENSIYRGAFAFGYGDLRVRAYPIVRAAERVDNSRSCQRLGADLQDVKIQCTGLEHF